MLLPKSSQAGYIGLVLISFLLVLSMLLYPYIFPQGGGNHCMVGNKPAEYKELELPGIKDLKSKFGEGKGGPSSDKAKFILIRENVPVYDGIFFLAENDNPPNEHAFRVSDPSMPEYVFYYPGQWVHFLFHRNVIASNNSMDNPNNNNLSHLQEGIVVAVKTDGQGNERKETNSLSGRPVRIADYYQIEEMYNAQKDYDVEELFYCTEELPDSAYSVMVPNQKFSAGRDQLQLEWFLFTGGSGMVYPHCKPAVYLYPEKKQLVNVRVYPKGELGYTDPPYDVNSGWTVEANPNGSLYQLLNSKYQGVKNNYLYYESRILDTEIKKPETGWVIKYGAKGQESEELKALLNRILPELGLNQKEQKDFMNYWLTKLPDSPYYFVGLVDKSQRDYFEPLTVTPSPDTSIRFSLFFEPLSESQIVNEPKIITPERKGFTLVDWGGMVKLHPGTPFTCSQ